MMPHDARNFWIATACALFALSSTIVAAACTDGDAANRAETLASPSALRLIGVWRATFWLDRPATLTRYAADSSPVVGTIAFTEDTHGLVSADELAGPTHDGVYDIDFSRFGFETRASGDFPGAIARISEAPRGKGAQTGHDSLSIVLSPGTQFMTVRMNGEIHGDTIAGVWTAATYRSGGGSGRFVMRRQAQ